jgi:hypothetical protein
MLLERAGSTLRPAALLPGLPAWTVDLSPAPQLGPGSFMSRIACLDRRYQPEAAWSLRDRRDPSVSPTHATMAQSAIPKTRIATTYTATLP